MNLDRNLYREDTTEDTSSSLGLTLQSQTPETIKMPYEKDTYGTADLVQPYIAGEGFVTDAGAIDTTKFFLPGAWVPSKTSTGVYKITHAIGDSARYLPLAMVNPTDASARLITITNQNNNDFTVRTFTQAGVPADLPFSFVVYQNL